MDKKFYTCGSHKQFCVSLQAPIGDCCCPFIGKTTRSKYLKKLHLLSLTHSYIPLLLAGIPNVMLTSAITDILVNSFCAQTEAIVVSFTLLIDRLMDNRQYYITDFS